MAATLGGRLADGQPPADRDRRRAGALAHPCEAVPGGPGGVLDPRRGDRRQRGGQAAHGAAAAFRKRRRDPRRGLQLSVGARARGHDHPRPAGRACLAELEATRSPDRLRGNRGGRGRPRRRRAARPERALPDGSHRRVCGLARRARLLRLADPKRRLGGGSGSHTGPGATFGWSDRARPGPNRRAPSRDDAGRAGGRRARARPPEAGPLGRVDPAHPATATRQVVRPRFLVRHRDRRRRAGRLDRQPGCPGLGGRGRPRPGSVRCWTPGPRRSCTGSPRRASTR